MIRDSHRLWNEPRMKRKINGVNHFSIRDTESIDSDARFAGAELNVDENQHTGFDDSTIEPSNNFISSVHCSVLETDSIYACIHKSFSYQI